MKGRIQGQMLKAGSGRKRSSSELSNSSLGCSQARPAGCTAKGRYDMASGEYLFQKRGFFLQFGLIKLRQLLQGLALGLIIIPKLFFILLLHPLGLDLQFLVLLIF